MSFIVKQRKEDYAGLVLEESKSYIMATTPLNPKGLSKQQKRLARIKRNLFRELKAFNKEMRRLPVDQIEGEK